MFRFFKRILKWYVNAVLEDYQFYRKRKGGLWYKIREIEVSGFASPGEYWVNKKPTNPDILILKEEDHL